jgi:hypothetical protein
VSGNDGNQFCPLIVTNPFGPPQDGQPAGIYQACKAMQWKMSNRGFSVGPAGWDGRWGWWSRDAVQRYLRWLGLIAGSAVDQPWDHDDNVAIQTRCGQVGFPTKIDGDFGKLTAEAVCLSLNSTRF